MLKTIDAYNFNTAQKRLMFVSTAESFRSDKFALQKLRAVPVMSGAGYHLKRKPRCGESLHLPGHGSGPGLSPHCAAQRRHRHPMSAITPHSSK